MTDAEKTIAEIIKSKVNVMNLFMKCSNMNPATFDRFTNELTGMLICLKNIAADGVFYTVNFYDDRIEFGFYKEDGSFEIIC